MYTEIESQGTERQKCCTRKKDKEENDKDIMCMLLKRYDCPSLDSFLWTFIRLTGGLVMLFLFSGPGVNINIKRFIHFFNFFIPFLWLCLLNQIIILDITIKTGLLLVNVYFCSVKNLHISCLKKKYNIFAYFAAEMKK